MDLDKTKAMLIHELTLINLKLENGVTCIRHVCNTSFTVLQQFYKTKLKFDQDFEAL